MFLGRLDEAGAYLDRAESLNPNNTVMKAFRCMWLNYVGRTNEALAEIDAVLRRDPFLPDWIWDLFGMAFTVAGRYEEAIGAYNREVQVPPWGYAYMAICHVSLGHSDETRQAMARYREVTPAASVATFLSSEPYRDPTTIARFRDALLKAGCPKTREGR